ncbi:FAD-dependent oxidoreductase [Halorubrum sp. Eb13]|uniref:FAD-dependent oxidoreductase n=1 Tax=Halorubrum sp. Eb13 TaxID=1383843 RepID=UPI000B996C68|nr:FAD-dependent oxidoreductase [Halorubrum sp. Eb13]OYR44044.1 thioredoxin reductase [Halorubrum sp. Eb13]
MSTTSPPEVVVIGGGVAGLSTAVFTARHGLDTLVVAAGESILRRNAHLENSPGFSAGVNGRQLLDLLEKQVAGAGCEQVTATVASVEDTDEGFAVETDAVDRYRTEYVVAATKNAVGYLADVDGVGISDRGKAFLDTDERGRTGVDGLYSAGRLAEKPHQAAVCAGHGAEVGVTILEDDERPFYHDWVAPEGYFTDRGRDLPPGCEEIDEAERADREARSLDVMGERFAEPHPDEQETHPRLENEGSHSDGG